MAKQEDENVISIIREIIVCFLLMKIMNDYLNLWLITCEGIITEYSPTASMDE